MENFSLRDLVQISLVSSLTAISAYIVIPLPGIPVPVTAQTLMLMVCGNVLGPGQAFWSMTSLLFLGAVGVPVFSGGAGGFGKLFGPTGGYLLAMPLAAYVISRISQGTHRAFFGMIMANLLGGIGLMYALGVPYLAWISGISLWDAFLIGALPFLPGDLIKVFLAASTARSLNRVFLGTKEISRSSP